jgi:hypothetical protein
MGKTLSTCQKVENFNKKKWYKHDLFVERNMNFSTWMEDLSEYIKDTRLIDLNLIRSHQSATYAIDTYFDKVSKCQHASVYYQLYGGVRVIDLRPGIYAPELTKITCGHGPHRAVKIEEIFNSIKNFLNEHEKEFVIIEMETAGKFFGVNHELTQEMKAELILMIERVFGNLLIRNTDHWFDISKVTMGEIWKQKKQLIIISHSFINNNHITTSAIFDMFTYQYGRYANTKCKFFMKKHVSKFLHSAQDKKSHFYNQFLSVNLQLTAQSIDSIFELNAKLHEDEFLYKWIIGLIKEGKRLNIVAFDFCFYNPQFVREIIYSNYFMKRDLGGVEVPHPHPRQSINSVQGISEIPATRFSSSELDIQVGENYSIQLEERSRLSNEIKTLWKKFKIEYLIAEYNSSNNTNSSHRQQDNLDEIDQIKNYLPLQSQEVSIDSIIYDNDIIKLKFHKINPKDSDKYISVDKQGKLFVQKKCNIYKMKRKLFQIQIVDKQQNIVKFKSCYLSCKTLKNQPSKVNDAHEEIFSSTSKSQLHTLKDYYLHVDSRNYKNPHLELSEEASLFKLNFTSEKRVCSIELITDDEKFNKKFISRCRKENLKVILDEKETEMFYLEK